MEDCIEVICSRCTYRCECGPFKDCVPKKILQKLVSKDVPEKVIFERQVGYISGHITDLSICPNCGVIFSKEVEKIQPEYCPKCGQHLIWELKR